MKKIGVLAVQGDVQEHLDAVERAAQRGGFKAHGVPVRRADDLEGVHALIIPGGESTTLSKMMRRNGLFDPVRKRASEGSLALLGTCAGMVIVARSGGAQAEKTRTALLELMDIDVDRNAFGRQRESFESDVSVEGWSEPLHAVFIRAPAVRRAYGGARVLARVGEWGVFAAQRNVLATAFHPELTRDPRVHAMLIDIA